MNKRHFFNVAGLLLLMMLIGSCEQSERPAEQNVIARVDDATLTLEEAKRNLPSLIDDVTADKEQEYLEKYRKRWISMQLLAQEAQRIKLNEQPEVSSKIKKVTNEILAQSLRDYWLNQTDTISVSREAAQTYYEANKEQFVLKERYVRFRHIQTATLTDNRKAKSDLLRGIPFNQVVEEYALDPIQTISNSKQFWPISVAVANYDALNRYLQIIGIEEISPIRRLGGRYHFVQLMEQKAKGEHPDIEWVLKRIQNWLEIEKRKKILSTLEQKIYLKAKVSNEIEEFEVQQ